MKFRFRLIRLAPVSRLRKIEWERRACAEIFRREIKQAKAEGNAELVESLRRDQWYEEDMLSEEEAYIRSNIVLSAARKLDIPLPPRPKAFEENEDWVSGQYFSKLMLSEAGRARLREVVRKEAKEVHEARTRWTAWIGPFTGLIGTIIALVALLTRK